MTPPAFQDSDRRQALLPPRETKRLSNMLFHGRGALFDSRLALGVRAGTEGRNCDCMGRRLESGRQAKLCDHSMNRVDISSGRNGDGTETAGLR